jgi:hypothetical protein
MSRLQLSGLLLAALAFCLLAFQFDALPITSSPFPADASLLAGVPTGYDPLTGQEMATIVAAAQEAADALAPRNATAGESRREPEVLLVERHESSKAAYAKGAWPREGDVYLYDYATDTLIYTTVDVQTSAVITVERVQGVQLPLTPREEQRALELVQADSVLWSTLTARYQGIMGETLQGLAQLQVKVSVFQADVIPDRVNAAAQKCGQHRCAQVLIFTVDKTLLDVMPIVDLSQGQVVQVLSEE